MSMHYNSIPGFFIDPPGFGLVDKSPTRWADFINKMNEMGPDYKVIFFARHGQGFHNVAMEMYPTEAWNDYWSKLDGNGRITWGPDPQLTALGIAQAESARDVWKSELAAGIPLPQKLYCSPLSRAIHTRQITFDGILPPSTPTIIVENCREINGVYTCDKRRARSAIHAAFPEYTFESGFAEEDTLWDPHVRETRQSVAERARTVLDGIFTRDTETFISITAHAAIINGFLTTMGRPPCALPTGGMLPVVVHCTR